jgi:hypothetical protein
MGGIEKLGSFEDHLDDMLVAVGFRCTTSVEVEKEDVHGGRYGEDLWDA